MLDELSESSSPSPTPSPSAPSPLAELNDHDDDAFEQAPTPTHSSTSARSRSPGSLSPPSREHSPAWKAPGQAHPSLVQSNLNTFFSTSRPPTRPLPNQRTRSASPDRRRGRSAGAATPLHSPHASPHHRNPQSSTDDQQSE
jgi:hypothetical protein